MKRTTECDRATSDLPSSSIIHTYEVVPASDVGRKYAQGARTLMEEEMPIDVQAKLLPIVEKALKLERTSRFVTLRDSLEGGWKDADDSGCDAESHRKGGKPRWRKSRVEIVDLVGED